MKNNVAERMRGALDRFYTQASRLLESGDDGVLVKILGPKLAETVRTLGRIKHAARGVALTLAAYKAIQPSQDIRRHKEQHAGGFSARTIDTKVTVPFLLDHSLPRSVESHFLTQTFSFAEPYTKGIQLRTAPKMAGPLFIEVVNAIEDRGSAEVGGAAATLIILELIRERNRGRVPLTKPKNLTIDESVELLRRHFGRRYKTNAPRLPQLAIYAVYQCLLASVKRYAGWRLEALLPMKAADRKAGTIGDVVLTHERKPIEAVEIKLSEAITALHVAEAIEKIRAASIERYLILSTAGVAAAEVEKISRLQREFRISNGCEIIVNHAVETVGYYLRLLRSPTEFIYAYTELIETDRDVDYEHRVAWNEECARLPRRTE